LASAQVNTAEATLSLMRSYREILNYLLIREQLSLVWKIGFFVVCGALLYGSLTLSRIRIQSVDVIGTVISDRVDVKDSPSANYLTVKLDNGETVRASGAGTIEYRPGQRVIVKETSANFFGVRKHEFKKYLDEPRRE
jgi:hypothetical protein